MAIRLKAVNPENRKFKLSETALHWTGICLVCLGTLSVAVIQRGQLHLDDSASLDLLNDALKESGALMNRVSMSVLYAALALIALPIYAKLLVETMHRSEHPNRVLKWLGLCALVSDFPYNWAMRGQWVDWSTQNPVWGLFLAAVMLLFFQRRAGLAPKLLAMFAAAAWAVLLRVDAGAVMVLLCALMELAKKESVVMAGGTALSLLYFPAPLGLVLVHFYDEDSPPAKYWLFALLYPAHLLVCGALGVWIGG